MFLWFCFIFGLLLFFYVVFFWGGVECISCALCLCVCVCVVIFLFLEMDLDEEDTFSSLLIDCKGGGGGSYIKA